MEMLVTMVLLQMMVLLLLLAILTVILTEMAMAQILVLVLTLLSLLEDSAALLMEDNHHHMASQDIKLMDLVELLMVVACLRPSRGQWTQTLSRSKCQFRTYISLFFMKLLHRDCVQNHVNYCTIC